MTDNQILKNYMKEKKYLECINILKEKIVTHLIHKIRIKDNSYQFTNVSDLCTASNFYLNNSTIAQSLEIALMQETALEQIESLLLICEQNNIT